MACRGLLQGRSMARCDLATTMTPEVSWSRRCTMPGRATPPMPPREGQWWRRAFTRVPVRCPGAGCTTSPAGLSMAMTSSSSNITLRGIASGSGTAGTGGGMDIVTTSPGWTRAVDRVAGTPLTATRPDFIRPWMRAREKSSHCPVSHTSRRSIPSGGMVKVLDSPSMPRHQKAHSPRRTTYMARRRLVVTWAATAEAMPRRMASRP